MSAELAAQAPDLFSGQQSPQNAFPLSEQKPTSRDPRYIPSIIPPNLRKQLQPGSQTVISPGGDIDLQQLMESQRAKKKSSQMDRYNEQRSEDLIKKDEYRFMEKRLADQFGINTFPDGEREEIYSETPGRRFQIIFFTSLPVTLGISYGIISTAANRRVFNGPQTAGIGFLGIFSSAMIAWYDHVQWKKTFHTSASLNNDFQTNSELSENIRIKIEYSELKRDPGFQKENFNLLSFRITLPFH